MLHQIPISIKKNIQIHQMDVLAYRPYTFKNQNPNTEFKELIKQNTKTIKSGKSELWVRG